MCMFGMCPVLYTLLATVDLIYDFAHPMTQLSINSPALVHIHMEQTKHSTWVGDRFCSEQSMISPGVRESARGKTFFLQESEQNGLSEERQTAEELHEPQRHSEAEDFVQQI
ncbi:hypothetical protein K438DRAFT_1768574 [Mycena galopus ATCC 62051]|nr:hypothetical protein K438DRAFT_1768574 [Mycena galopus ATCC 62051]